MALDDFIMTMDSDGEEAPPLPSAKPSKTKAKTTEPEDAQLNLEFSFNLAEDPYMDAFGQSEDVDDLVQNGSKPVRTFLYITPTLEAV